MNFFKELAAIAPGVQLTMTVKEKNGKLTISLLPDGLAHVKPLIMTGTPDELDEGFINAIRQPVLDAQGIVVQNEAFQKSLEEAKNTKPEKGGKPAPKKKEEDQEAGEGDEEPEEPAKEAAKKKAPPEKKAVAKPEPPKVEGPKPVSMF
jgi:PRTRC genetic system protein E